MVEYKVDMQDGPSKWREINPTFFGVFTLLDTGSADFPYLLYELVMKGRLNIND